MKFLVFLLCTLAFASAGYPYYSPYPQHIPIIDHNGVPVETPEVQAAKAQHFAAHAAAKYGHPAPAVYSGHYGYAAITPDGKPLDTPEVQLANAAHFIAYNQAALRNAHPYAAAADGPIDTPEVQIAKAAHFEAHAEAKARSGHHYRKRRSPGYGYPVNGGLVEAPDVQAAKAAHFAAHAAIAARNNHAPAYSGPAYSGQQSYSGPTYSGPYHIPVIGPNGVPVETPEVQAAKASHFAEYSKANQGSTGYSGNYSPAPTYGGHYAPAPVSYGNGAPVDTPEVQAAKAAHLAAHAQASGHHY